jgi:hypothetical protein
MLNLEKEQSASPAEPTGALPPSDDSAPRGPAFLTLQKRPWAAADLFRAFLIILSLLVAAGFVLVLLPQPTVDRFAKDLRSRYGPAQQDGIALLYLGDEVKDNEFHVRGVIRNITNAPIEHLDAAIRFFSLSGAVAETVLVRMDKEIIASDVVAQFHLVYPNYKMEFSRYAVEFKLRDGALIPYKDLRDTRVQSDGKQ